MDIYKDYLQQLQRVTLDQPFINILEKDLIDTHKEIVKRLVHIKLDDGEYHTLFGDIKNCVCHFLLNWMDNMDIVIKKADDIKNTANKSDLMAIIDHNIDSIQSSQIDFGNEYLPVTNSVERRNYEEVEAVYKIALEHLYELKARVEKFEKPEHAETFAKEMCDLTLMRRRDIFEFTHKFISLFLADRVNNIKASLEEIISRCKRNLVQLKYSNETNLNELKLELYNSNKEYLKTIRQTRNSEESAKLLRQIEKVKEKIGSSNDMYIAQLEVEMAHWNRQQEEFKKIAEKLIKLRMELEKVHAQEQEYNSKRSTELPGTKLQYWQNMGENFKEQRDFLEENIIKTAKTLVTFFHVGGRDRYMAQDHVGAFYLDEFGHQVYSLESGVNTFHINSDGKPKHIPEHTKYYYDSNGRYILDENGQKVYQVAPCCSRYKLNGEHLLEKVTEDCGHSTAYNQECRVSVVDPNKVNQVIPDIFPDPNFKDKIDAESKKYLWEAFGGILPEVLRDVADAKPKNPIHYVAHKLLRLRNQMDKEELKKKNREALQYKEEILRQRTEKAMAVAREWSSRQVRRRKPEESDDTQERTVYDAHVAGMALVNDLNTYNNF